MVQIVQIKEREKDRMFASAFVTFFMLDKEKNKIFFICATS